MVHISPGIHGGNPDWRMMREEKSERLNAIFRKYGRNIIAIYSAHAHSDTYQIYYDEG